MKYKVLFLLAILCFADSEAMYKKIECYRQSPDLTTPSLKVWKFPELVIHGGDYINPGFKVKIRFSTPKPVNRMIMEIGMSQGAYYKYAIALFQKDNRIILQRVAKYRNTISSYQDIDWKANLLQTGLNYVLTFEMDETRCRYTIFEEGKETSTTYNEYVFNGLMCSYVKELLSQGTFSVGINPQYYVESIEVADLGTGVGVAVPKPEPQKSFVNIFNYNSKKYMGLLWRSLDVGNLVVQKKYQVPGCDFLWLITPEYDQKRTPNRYGFTFKNMYSGLSINVQNCSHYNEVPLQTTNTQNCTQWVWARSEEKSDWMKLYNPTTENYGVILSSTATEKEQVKTWATADHASGHWVMTRRDFTNEWKPETFYALKHKLSGLYITPAVASYQGTNVVQYGQSDSESYVWYISERYPGIYTILNVDHKRYLTVEDMSLKANANVILSKDEIHSNGMWQIESVSGTPYYTIKNLNSQYYAEVKGASTLSGAGIIQYDEVDENSYWQLVPIKYTPHGLLGGIFRIKSSRSGKYMAVVDGSLESGAGIVLEDKAVNPNSWWKFIEMEDGGIGIQNVNSQLFLNIPKADTAPFVYVIQFPRNPVSENMGNSLWRLEHDPATPNEYWIKNLHSGMYLSYQLPQTGAPVMQMPKDIIGLEGTWIFELVE